MPAGPNSRKTSVSASRKKSLVSLHDPTSPLNTHPPNCPPSLANRIHETNALFTYYSTRGNKEILRSPEALEKCLETTHAPEKCSEISAFPDYFNNVPLYRLPRREEDPLSSHGTAVKAPSISVQPHGGNAFHTAAVAGPSTDSASAAEAPETTSPAHSSGTAAHRKNPNDAIVSAFLRPHRDISTEQTELLPERHFVVPALPPIAEPLFPRLRGPAGEEHAVFLHLRKEEEKAERIKDRHHKATLAPVEQFYSALTRVPGPITNEITEGLRHKLAKAEQAGQKIAEKFAHSGKEPEKPGGGSTGIGLSARRHNNTSPAVVSPHGSIARGFPAGPDTPSSQQFHGRSGNDADETLSLGGAGGWANRSGLLSPAQGGAPPRHAGEIPNAYTTEAGVPPPKEKLVTDMLDAFVGAYYLEHPDAKQRIEEAEAEAKRKASLLGAKKKKKKSTAPLPREGEPAPALHVFKSALLAHCDDNGMLTLAQLEEMLRDVPFEVKNTDAIRMLFQYVRQESETRTMEVYNNAAEEGSTSNPANLQRNEFENSVSTTISKRSFAGPPEAGASTVNVNAARSVRDVNAMSSTNINNTRRSMASNNFVRTSNSLQREASIGMIGREAASFAEKPPELPVKPPATVYARELLAAIDELANGAVTRDVVRWICFQVFGDEGQGYIHKNTLANIKKTRRGECEGPSGPVTPSMIKCLFDCFDDLALEEEAAYLKANFKGKKRKKPPALPPHQKSIIPLHVMRKAHINFKDFIAYFDRLPQVPAAFMHVWLPLLLTGKISLPEGSEVARSRPSRNSVTTIQDHPVSESIANASGSGGLLLSKSHTNESGSTRENSQQDTTSTAQNIILDKTSISASVESEHFSKGPEEPEEMEPGTYPLVLLGTDIATRSAVVQRLVTQRVQMLKQGLQELRGSFEDQDPVGSPSSITRAAHEGPPSIHSTSV